MSILMNFFCNSMFIVPYFYISTTFLWGQWHSAAVYSTCSSLLLNNYCCWTSLLENKTINGVLHSVVQRFTKVFPKGHTVPLYISFVPTQEVWFSLVTQLAYARHTQPKTSLYSKTVNM